MMRDQGDKEIRLACSLVVGCDRSGAAKSEISVSTLARWRNACPLATRSFFDRAQNTLKRKVLATFMQPVSPTENSLLVVSQR
jgi:hypothetical protein